MKRLLLAIIGIFSFVAYAQESYDYRPLATEGKVWYFKIDDSYTNNLYYSYIIKGDTVINETAYKKLYMQHSRFFLYTAALRDEGTRAYMVPADSTREFIYYDMELQETIDLAYGLGAKPNGRDWSGALRITTFLSTYLPYHTWFTWVESVGEVDDDYFRCSFWRNPCSGMQFSGNRLVSCIEDGKYIWGTGTPNPTWYEVPLIYENKVGDHREPSEIWVEWEKGCLIFYFKDVKDDFNIYLDGNNIGTYFGPFKGNRYLTYAISDGICHAWIESANERFYFQVRNEIPKATETLSCRPFIEEGKVWKVGWFPEGSDVAEKIDYYYIFGDTVVNDLPCKNISCFHETDKSQENFSNWRESVGALYEDGGRVYLCEPHSERFNTIYDINAPEGTNFLCYGKVANPQLPRAIATVIKRENGVGEGFKGVTSTVSLKFNLYPGSKTIQEQWMEGVGSKYRPLDNAPAAEGYNYKLMSCTLGDEVLYYNPDMLDGAIYGETPEGADVKKQWIDFTHIKKPRPKAPARERTANETDEENLTGEYSAKELFVNLKILSGAYTVTLKDAAGNEVYRKEVQTSSTIALNTDLTKYPEGTYTLVVENSEEQYTATLTLPLDDVAVRDIPASIVNGKSVNSKCFDLSGRQLSTPPAKGIYIRDGKKVVR